MRGILDRAGAVFDRDVPEGSRSLLAGWRTEIVATDLSLAVLEKSKAGIFSQFEVQRGLPIQLLVKYFTQNGELWQISPEIRGMIQHRQLNLLQDFSHLGTFDIIFCRNVLIYFDQTTKANIFERIARMMEPDGVLALGAAEFVVGITNTFKPFPERRGLYRPNVAPVLRRRCIDHGAANAARGGVGGPLNVPGGRPGQPGYTIACGRKRDVLPVIGFSSSRIDSPHGTWSTTQLPSTGYCSSKLGSGA